MSERLRGVFGGRSQENATLGQFVRAGVGGVAEHLCVVETTADLIKASALAVEAKRPLTVIGGGTGSLFSHVGSVGLVVVNRTSQIHFSASRSMVVVESGVSTHRLVSAAASRGLGGLEFLVGIPGSIGGALLTEAEYGGKTLRPYLRAVVVWYHTGTEEHVVTIPESELEIQAGHVVGLPAQSPPVVLALHLQLSRLYPEEVMRRIKKFRRRALLVSDPRSIIGSPFRPFLENHPQLYGELRRVRVPGLRLLADEGVVTALKSDVQPPQLRSFLNKLQATAAHVGTMLEPRLAYLGYWPDEGE